MEITQTIYKGDKLELESITIKKDNVTIELNSEEIQLINKINNMSKNQKQYIGDIKWVLYQYICDMDTAVVHIRCGNYAFEKLSTIIKQTPYNNVCRDNFGGTLNGESVSVQNVFKMNKKQIILSSDDTIVKYGSKFDILSDTIYPDDIVLYFA